MRLRGSVGKPGRPPLEPRIEALEVQVAKLEAALKSIKLFDKSTDDYLLSKQSPYAPQFDKWPSR